MKTWSDVVLVVLAKIEERCGALQKESIPRLRVSIAALSQLRTEGRPYVLNDADWRDLGTWFLIHDYAMIRFGTEHIALVRLDLVARWPRVAILEHGADSPDVQ